ncbi:uncharacterized protein GGS25DRAFT_78711 [Hypoxylon fragiforme]|uniref:uncharacterized protein n=1 Tax=Hypoxylon fragiforme TaxID=63214 RepID=UPI0020C67C5A|nr:uncharacterized protein GGS25DRAFT_78711 [Hypoxylon fragiforme]KAI2603038.1 hypothetical protein GGS25DRAFT_78711 [Hypoxylon fragiforme]
MNPASPHTNISKWNDKVQKCLAISSFGKGPNIISKLIIDRSRYDTLHISVRPDEAFAMPMRDYVQSSKIIGDLTKAPNNLSIPLDKIHEDDRGKIVVVCGTPRPCLLQLLGSRLNIAPELFLGHIDPPVSFRPGSLPSRPTNIFTVQFISIGFYPDKENRLDMAQKLGSNTVDYIRDLLQGQIDGMERVRGVSLHGDLFFTVQQSASLLVHQMDNTQWSGILMTDCGPRLASPPWTPISQYGAYFYPLNTSHPMSLIHPLHWDSNAFISHPNPFLARAEVDTAMSEDIRRSAPQEPLAFVADMLETSALCWLQFLAFVQKCQHSRLSSLANERAEYLQRDKLALDHAILYFTEAIDFLDGWGDSDNLPRWPACRPVGSGVNVSDMATSLQRDFRHLRDKAETLSQKCNENIAIAMNTMSIWEAQRSLVNAHRATVITYLAFFFVPMTLVASLFGMNVQELSDSRAPETWVYFVIAIPLTLLCLSVPWYFQWNESRSSQSG